MSRTIYLDQAFRCHLVMAEGYIPYETDVFDDKCDTFLEGYRIVPDDMAWTRDDGVTFTGLMIAPHRSMEILEAAQAEYEKAQDALAEMAESVLDLTDQLIQMEV